VDFVTLAAVGTAAFIASLIGSVTGSGATAVLLPVLVFYFGVRESIPILTIANLASNLGRVWFNRAEISTKVVGYFALGAIPLAIVGALIFVRTPAQTLTRFLGGFLLVTVVWRRLRPKPPSIDSATWFTPLGAGFGLLSGLLEGIGPLMAPFFLSYGLLRGAYIGTDALATVLMQVPKLAVFGGMDMLDNRILANGLVITPFMFLGAFAGKQIVNRISESQFSLLIDLTLVLAGLNFLLRG
jgi:uncharacterized membrane protein YfcA